MSMRISYNWLFSLGIIATFISSILLSCQKDSLITDSSAKLTFSTDTLRFDTAFTQIGTAVYSFRIHNTHNQAIKISRIYLPGKNGKKSFFDLNIDGNAGNDLKDIEIPANDSIYAFVRVTINPNLPLSISPYVITEDLIFETNGNTQKVILEAWGQDANYIPSKTSNGKVAILNGNGQEIVWGDSKPYVIYGILLLENVKLTLPAGTRIHVHGGIAKNDSLGGRYNDGIIYVFPTAKLNVKGTKENPVIFEGDRLEDDFKEEPGQWGGIILGAGSTDNVFEYATIKNSIIGIRMDSASSMRILNSRIFNIAGNGIQASHATIYGENNLIYNCTSDALRIVYGGNYQLNYCTIVSYGQDAIALKFSNTICYDQFCNNFDTYPLYARFNNCIFFGSKVDQIDISNKLHQTKPQEIDYQFINCVFRIRELLTKGDYQNFLTNTQDCVQGSSLDRLFVKPDNDDYHLDSLSIADGKAFPIPNINIDLENVNRDAIKPDVGCFEKIK